MRKLRIGLYGVNGHQVDGLLSDLGGLVELVAVCGLPEERIRELRMGQEGNMVPEPDAGDMSKSMLPARYVCFADFLKHPGLEFVSLCSPDRSRQYGEIRAALEAGLHVYAEKPAVLEERELDDLLRVARSRGLIFREMAPTSYEAPYSTIGELVSAGEIGDVIQVFVQKSYPYADWRPQREALDGGLLLQVGVHAIRLVEQTARRMVRSVSAIQTQAGNPVGDGELHMAASIQMHLDNGGIASAVLNYLNCPGSGVWGNDKLHIFGTKGFVESAAGNRQILLAAGDEKRLIDPGPKSKAGASHFEMTVREALGHPTHLLPAEAEFESLRVVLRARESAGSHGRIVYVRDESNP